MNRPVDRDLHHPFHYKNEWTARKESLYIRNRIVAKGLARTAHNLLHAENGAVPVPGYHTLARVARQLPSGLHVLDGIDTYCSLVEQSNQHPNIKPLEVKLNDLSIEALRGQIPYIIDGLPSKRTIIT